MKEKLKFLWFLAFTFLGAALIYGLALRGPTFIYEKVRSAFIDESEASTWEDIQNDWRPLPPNSDPASDEAVEWLYKSFFSLVEKGHDPEFVRKRIYSFLNSLFLISKNEGISLDDKKHLEIQKENVKEIFGYLPDLSREEWRIVWFRHFYSLADRTFDVILGAPRYSITVLLNSEDILPGIKDPFICAQIAKEHFLMVQESGADDADWRIRAYEDALSVHMHNLHNRDNKRDYFLLLQEFFPYRLGTYPDFIEGYLAEVAEFSDISSTEKEKFFALVDKRLKSIKKEY